MTNEQQRPARSAVRSDRCDHAVHASAVEIIEHVWLSVEAPVVTRDVERLARTLRRRHQRTIGWLDRGKCAAGDLRLPTSGFGQHALVVTRGRRPGGGMAEDEQR